MGQRTTERSVQSREEHGTQAGSHPGSELSHPHVPPEFEAYAS